MNKYCFGYHCRRTQSNLFIKISTRGFVIAFPKKRQHFKRIISDADTDPLVTQKQNHYYFITSSCCIPCIELNADSVSQMKIQNQ